MTFENNVFLFFLFNEFIKVNAACISMHIMAAHAMYVIY
jgi:hypothetical protein